ncbi:MAG TPA: hypothetical protein VMU04_23375 [Candidatus Acidoferrum sp.]|nr:hypothetical protein [Candidatus Acidoferrum sp.]
MGLTISYELALKAEVSPAVVRELVRRTAPYARKIGCAQVSGLLQAEKCEGLAPLLFSPRRAKDTFLSWVEPERGWLVQVSPGPGCETALFGLCQYPRRIGYGRGQAATGFRGGWWFRSFCKTQYAGAHGWDNFWQCHLRVISLLDFWRGLGARVKVNDESDYWESRSVEKLRESLGSYNGFVAAMGGMLKDAEEGSSVRAPIFTYQHFERLEHEGWRRFGARLERLQAMMSNLIAH